ncbi:MAG: DNA-3-methyladenine glycosylase 2 family protein [Microbacteriaceae bacterium]|nr:DNA-3-methyladenine glycosylase 2 family protein [Microbacteriaceae bacterium]
MTSFEIENAGGSNLLDIFGYLDRHSIPSVENTTRSSYGRLINSNHSQVRLEIELVNAEGARQRLLASVDGQPLDDEQLTRVRGLLSLDVDSLAIDNHLGKDQILKPWIQSHPGLQLPGSWDPGEELLRTMIGQQVSVSAARTTLSRLCIGLTGKPAYFPTYSEIAARGHEFLRGPRRRIESVIGIASALASEDIQFAPQESIETLKQKLLDFPGIGPWTVGYLAMRSFSDLDVFLETDLVILKAAKLLGIPDSPKQLSEFAKRWAPYRSIASLYLWHIAISSRSSSQEV